MFLHKTKQINASKITKLIRAAVMVIPPLITLLQSTYSFLPSNRLLSACSYDRSGIKQVAPLRAINRLLDSKVHTDSAEKVSMRPWKGTTIEPRYSMDIVRLKSIVHWVLLLIPAIPILRKPCLKQHHSVVNCDRVEIFLKLLLCSDEIYRRIRR